MSFPPRHKLFCQQVLPCPATAGIPGHPGEFCRSSQRGRVSNGVSKWMKEGRSLGLRLVPLCCLSLSPDVCARLWIYANAFILFCCTPLDSFLCGHFIRVLCVSKCSLPAPSAAREHARVCFCFPYFTSDFRGHLLRKTFDQSRAPCCALSKENELFAAWTFDTVVMNALKPCGTSE